MRPHGPCPSHAAGQPSAPRSCGSRRGRGASQQAQHAFWPYASRKPAPCRKHAAHAVSWLMSPPPPPHIPLPPAYALPPHPPTQSCMAACALPHAPCGSAQKGSTPLPALTNSYRQAPSPMNARQVAGSSTKCNSHYPYRMCPLGLGFGSGGDAACMRHTADADGGSPAIIRLHGHSHFISQTQTRIEFDPPARIGVVPRAGPTSVARACTTVRITTNQRRLHLQLISIQLIDLNSMLNCRIIPRTARTRSLHHP